MSAAVHARTLELAAIAIDFDLAPDEADELRGHLDACEPCRADAASLRGDAAAIQALPRVDAPPRVERAVLAGRQLSRTRSAGILVNVVVVLIIALVPLSAVGLFRFGGGAPAGPAGKPPIETPVAAPTLAPPAPSPSPSPSPSPGLPGQP